MYTLGDYSHSPVHQGQSTAQVSGLHSVPTDHYLHHAAPPNVPIKSESPIMMNTDQPLTQNVVYNTVSLFF